MIARSIEIKMESHRLAIDRRRNNKPIWDRKINIHSILRRDPLRTDTEYVVSIAHEIAELLKASLPKEMLDSDDVKFDAELEEAIDALRNMSVQDFEDTNYKAVDEFNGWLSQVYDRADINRLWLGQ